LQKELGLSPRELVQCTRDRGLLLLPEYLGVRPLERWRVDQPRDVMGTAHPLSFPRGDVVLRGDDRVGLQRVPVEPVAHLENPRERLLHDVLDVLDVRAVPHAVLGETRCCHTADWLGERQKLRVGYRLPHDDPPGPWYRCHHTTKTASS
jgi:hypothetical protein